MLQLYHFPLDPFSRAIRIALGEYGISPAYREERPWERRQGFLALNPAGALPLLIDGENPPVCGAGPIAEYLDETRGRELGDRRLYPDDPLERAEMRRLMEWFDRKFHDEVTLNIVHEKVDRRFMLRDEGGGPPDMVVVHAGLSNIRYHLAYIEHLLASRNWLAGARLSHADLSAAGHLSAIDYLGHVPWDDYPAARTWYARLKSRPSFRPLLADKLAGMPPANHYVDLDF